MSRRTFVAGPFTVITGWDPGLAQFHLLIQHRAVAEARQSWYRRGLATAPAAPALPPGVPGHYSAADDPAIPFGAIDIPGILARLREWDIPFPATLADDLDSDARENRPAVVHDYGTLDTPGPSTLGSVPSTAVGDARAPG